MFNWADNTMYIVKNDVGAVIAIFDTEKRANKFAKKNKNYYVDDVVKYSYKDFYYKELQAVTVQVVATRFDANISVIKDTKTTEHDMQVKEDTKNGIFGFTFAAGTFDLEHALVYIRVWFMENRLDKIVEMPWKLIEY